MGNSTSTRVNSSPLALRKSRSKNLLDIQILEFVYETSSVGDFSKLPHTLVGVVLKYLTSVDLCRLSLASKGMRKSTTIFEIPVGLHELANTRDVWDYIKATELKLNKSAVSIPEHLLAIHPKAQIGSLQSIRSDVYNYLFTGFA